jgi:hypothetical protein
MAEGLLQGLLKTPQQVREEQLLRMQQQAVAGRQLQSPLRASSALPGIFSNVLAQQAPALATDVAQAARGITQGVGGMLGAVGQQGLGQAVAGATISPEERQAAQAQQVAQGIDRNNPDSLEAAAKRFQQLGLMGPADQLATRATELRTKQNQEQAVVAQREATAKFLEGRKNADLANAVRIGAVPVNIAVENALKGVETVVVGESLVNKQTGAVLYSAPPKPGEKYELVTDAEKRKLGLNPNTPYQKNTETGQIKAVTGGSSLVMGTPPQGYRIVETIDDEGRPSVYMEPIPGSPQAKAEAAQTEAALAGLRNTGEKVSAVTSTIDEALTILKDPDVAGRTGAAIDLAGRLTGGVATAGTQRINLTEKLTTIKANIGFDRLQKMRDESPTGGALGQVAIQELVALQASIASLNPNLKAEDLRFNLARVKEQYNSTAEALANAYTDEQLIKQGVPELIKYRTRTTTPSGDIVELPTERKANGFDISKLPAEVKELWSVMTDEEKKLFGWTP